MKIQRLGGGAMLGALQGPKPVSSTFTLALHPILVVPILRSDL